MKRIKELQVNEENISKVLEGMPQLLAILVTKFSCPQEDKYEEELNTKSFICTTTQYSLEHDKEVGATKTYLVITNDEIYINWESHSIPIDPYDNYLDEEPEPKKLWIKGQDKNITELMDQIDRHYLFDQFFNKDACREYLKNK